MRVKSEAELLRQVPLFADADPAHLQIIAFAAPPVDVLPGAMLCQAGDSAPAAFLILSGTAEILSADGGLIGTAGPGAFIGERTLLSGAPLAVSLKAVDALKAVRIEHSLVMRVAGEFPEFAQGMARALSERLDATLEALKEAEQQF